MTAKEMIYNLPQRMKAGAGVGIDIIYHFVIDGDGGGKFSVHVNNGVCNVEEGLIGEPKCVISAHADDYADVESGKLNPQMALMFGKIKVSNLGSMMKFIEMFEKVQA